MIGNPVPYANVTVTYQNATVADSKLTDASGWTKFVLLYGMTNATDMYPMGNYTVTAVYEYHSAEATIEMTTNKQLTLTLEFVLPEFPTVTLALLLISATVTLLLIKQKTRKDKIH